MSTRERFAELRELYSEDGLDEATKAEFYGHLREFGRLNSHDGTYCVCDNNYGCDPSNPPLAAIVRATTCLKC